MKPIGCRTYDRKYRLGFELSEIASCALQRLIAGLERWIFDEPFALRQRNKVGTQRCEDGINIGLDVGLNIDERNFKRLLHRAGSSAVWAFWFW